MRINKKKYYTISSSVLFSFIFFYYFSLTLIAIFDGFNFQFINITAFAIIGTPFVIIMKLSKKYRWVLNITNIYFMLAFTSLSISMFYLINMY